MSGPSGGKILVTVLFVLIGLPPGLCSLYGMGVVLSASSQLDSQGWQYAQLFVAPSVVGLVIFGFMLWLLIRTWRRSSP